MPFEAVQPLRINKGAVSTSPAKMVPSSPHGPLTEIGLTERRRNSPSYNQSTKQMMLKRETSPFNSSPWSAERTNSPRAFWKERDPVSPSRLTSSENGCDQEISLSPQRRSSIENLKKVSRVKNSSMFEREQQNQYDPASPRLDRPLASGRPLSLALHGNAFKGEGMQSLRKSMSHEHGHKRGQSLTGFPTTQASPEPNEKADHPDTTNDYQFPLQRPLRRQAKSVTFDSGPPEVNEYEMVTPDPSSIASGSRESSFDDENDSGYAYDAYDAESLEDNDSFDASLEDTEKTPVVLPEHWRHSSTETADSELAPRKAEPSQGSGSGQDMFKRSGSAMSDSERPLPPLPNPRDELAHGLSAAAERIGTTPRSLPSPPQPAKISKAEILDMQKQSSMSVEDRLRLMGLQETQRDTSPTRQIVNGRATRAAKLQAAHNKDRGLGIQIHEDATADDKFINGHDSNAGMLNTDGNRAHGAEPSNPYDGSGYGDDFDYANLDPDVPLPSREVSDNFNRSANDNGGHSPSGLEKSKILYDVAGMARRPESISTYAIKTNGGSQKQNSFETNDPPTPRMAALASTDRNDHVYGKDGTTDLNPRISSNSLPEFESMMDDDDFKSGLASFLPYEETRNDKVPASELTMETNGHNIGLPVLEQDTSSTSPSQPPSLDSTGDIVSAEEEDIPSSPGSVIHHGAAKLEEDDLPEFIPERLSSIKSPGSKLKARPSLTSGDIESLATHSEEDTNPFTDPVPSIPRKSSRRRSSIGVAQPELDDEDEDEYQENDEHQVRKSEIRKSSLQKIELASFSSKDDFGLSLELGEEFDRVIEAQKKGYMMRENTKVVVARARDFSDEKAPAPEDLDAREPKVIGNQLGKSGSQSQPWTTEQWNRRQRRKSIRTPSGSRKQPFTAGVMPPLPGQESSVVGVLDDTSNKEQVEECEWEEGSERGRLFVKVVGVKDLDLPLPQHEKTQFQLTLDNGLHCVTTSWLQLSQTASIGQEFELVVLNDLEFQLTLQAKIVAPQQVQRTVTAPHSPTKPTPNNMKKKSFSHLLMSPKKRKEVEAKRAAEEEEARNREAIAAKHRTALVRAQPKTAWDLLHDLVGMDGSFARAYVSLKSFEDNCYGRPLSVDIPCYNEWAEEHDPSVIESMRSKRGNRAGEVVRMPPYQIGKLQLILLYVPKPKGAKDEDMPRSLNSAVREMDRVRESREKKWEGILSQQGGDCPYWRRRFFRLAGTKLTAFHESTRQPRATINLVKAVKLIDDKSSLVQDPASKPSKKGRRKSAFAEEEEGYMFVEEGFRIRFANGETIDFYADNATQKAEWMRVLSEVIGKPGRVGNDGHKGWTDLVLRREQRRGFDRKPLPSGSVKKKEAHGEAEVERPSSEQGQKRSMLEANDVLGDLRAAPQPRDHSPNKEARMRSAMSQAERRAKTRSMIF